MPMKRTPILAPLLLFGAFVAGCQLDPVDPSEVVTVTGVVVDDASGRPIAGATVAMVPATSVATSAADGSFSIPNVSGGYYTISATAPGYRAASEEIAARLAMPALTLRLRDSIPRAG